MIIGGDYFRDDSILRIMRYSNKTVKIFLDDANKTEVIYKGQAGLTQDQYERAILDLEFSMSRRKG